VRATHEIDWRTPPKQRLVLARQAVERYARAGMVVTRRLHAYLPCLGLGTPVVCTRTRGKRFSGLDELDVAAAAESLSRTCREAVARCAAPETVAPAGVAPEPEGGRGSRRAGAMDALVVPPARQEPRPPAWQELRPPHWQEPRPPAWEDLDELYEDHILTHAESRTHRGRMDHPTRSGALHNSLCGDVVRLALRLDATGRIVEARFDGRGCVVSQAGAAILCTVIEGADVAMARALTPQRMLELVRVPLSPARRSCALLAHRCLQEILAAR
jgi:nitrogen fixation NifU-like protein